MAKTADLSKLSDDDLVSENQRLGRDADAIREQRLEIHEELARRAAENRARVALAGMSPEQAKVVQAVAAEISVRGDA